MEGVKRGGEEELSELEQDGDFTLAIKEKRAVTSKIIYSRLPETLSSSHRTTVTFCPFKSSFATVDARRPRRCALPSTRTSDENILKNGGVFSE